jgi:hypothetical protein
MKNILTYLFENQCFVNRQDKICANFDKNYAFLRGTLSTCYSQKWWKKVSFKRIHVNIHAKHPFSSHSINENKTIPLIVKYLDSFFLIFFFNALT